MRVMLKSKTLRFRNVPPPSARYLAGSPSEGSYTGICHPSYVVTNSSDSVVETDVHCLFRNDTLSSGRDDNASTSQMCRPRPANDVIPKHLDDRLHLELQAHRSKSLSQIDCISGSGSSMRCHDMESKSEPNSTITPPPGQGSDRLVVPCQLDDAENRHRSIRGTQKMPSQEYFSVTIDVVPDSSCEIIPASRGVALRDALQGLLEYRGVDINDVNIFLDASSTPLPLQFETFRLGGHRLIVKSKETTEGHITRTNSTGSCGSGRTTLSSSSAKDEKKERKSSGSQRGRRSAMMTSTEDLYNDVQPTSLGGSQDGSWKGNKARLAAQRRGAIFTNPFKTEKEKMETLTELLNQYSQHGIPELHALLTFTDQNEQSDDPYQLEDHWTQIVSNVHELTKYKQNQQEAIWELLSTEVFYIRRLKVIIDLFLSVLCNLQNELILNEIDTEKVFGNIREVYETNHHFWVEYLLPMLNEARSSRSPLNPVHMKEGFLRFDQIFQPYLKYCLEQNQCLQYVKERHKESELFKAYVVWCETQKDCERLRLVDLLVKPMQRLTKYSLLLKAIHKKTDNNEHRAALVAMNESVENFVCGVDATLRQRHEKERLASIISRIESYRLSTDSSNDELEKVIKDHCFLDLTCPMPECGNQQSRQLLTEGTGLRLRDAPSSKQIDVQCFLFTDMLLICKAAGKKGDRVRVIRQPYIVDRLVLQELKDGSGILAVYLNEYKVAITGFILYTNDTKQWLDNIRRAQELYKQAKTAAASQRPELGFLKPIEEDEDYDFPSMALLAARSPRSSSRSSLVHSHSGSIDMNEVANNPLVAGATSPIGGGQSQPKAVSIELGELRNPSMTVDDVSQVRAKSMETWQSGPISVTVTSPRPERRAFFLRGAGGNITPNTLSVGVPYQMGDTTERITPAPIQVPTITTPKISEMGRLNTSSQQRGVPANIKPPLIKMKNLSSSLTPASTTEEQPTVICLGECDRLAAGGELAQSEVCTVGVEDESSRKPGNKRLCRAERRYHTADSIESIKKEKDHSIHKRLSLNYGQQSTSGMCSGCEKALRNKHLSQCLSMESVHSSSGVSSNTSLHLSAASVECDESLEGSDILEEDPLQIEDHTDAKMLNGGHGTNVTSDQVTVGPPGSNIKIDISEVRDGISSVQLADKSGSVPSTKPSKEDYRRIKEFLLTNCTVEASEV